MASKPRYGALKTRIHCRDFEQSLAFYRDILGLSLLKQWHSGADRGAILTLGGLDGDAFVELGEDLTLAPRQNNSGLSLQLQVTDAADMARQLQGRWPFRGPVARPWHSRYLYLEDPEGLQIILFDGEI